MALLTTGDLVQTQTFLAFSTPSQTGPLPSTTVTWTNLGPLTTTFTAPSQCDPFPTPNLWASLQVGSDRFVTSLPCGYLASTPDITSLTCSPSGSAYSSLWASGNLSEYYSYQTYMSPGLVCPSGWTTGQAVTLDAANATATSIDAFTVQATGTHVFCCPT